MKSTRNDTTLHKEGVSSTSTCGMNQNFHAQLGTTTQDSWVLQTVQGFCLPLIMTPSQMVAPAEMVFSVEQESMVSVEIQTLIQKGAVS